MTTEAKQEKAAEVGRALTTKVLSQDVGLYNDRGSLVEAIKALTGRVHLVSPTLNPDHIPDFHSVSARYVVLDPKPEHGDVYETENKGKFAPTAVALMRIWAAMGGTWDPVHSRRLDDGSERDYVHYRAVGHLPNLDGSRRTVMGEKEVDLRDGSALAKSMKERQLPRAREHILGLAETKARNRAIRSVGIRQSYTLQELATKPFVCLSLVFTGRSEDPELERLAKEKMIDAALATSRELYSAPPAGELGRSAPPAIEVHAPPPLKVVDQPAAEDDDDDSLDIPWDDDEEKD